MRVPAALLAVPLLGGAAAGVHFLDATPDRFIFATAAAAVLCAIAGAGFFADAAPPAVIGCVIAGCALAGCSMGASAARDLLASPLACWFDAHEPSPDGPVIVEGTLRDDAALVPYGTAMTVEVTAVREPAGAVVGVRGGARLIVAGSPAPEAAAGWTAGRTVRAPATLRRPMWFSNPGVPDDRRVQALRGTALTGSIKSAALVEVVAAGGWIDERAASLRAWTRRVIASRVGRLDPRSAAVATAILIGDRTGLSDEDERRLQDAGTYHVIAISGGNVAILAALLIFGLRLIRVPHHAGAAVSIAVLLFYAEVAGGAASVHRAVSAAVIFLVALILDHRGAPLNVVAVAALLACAWHPVAIVDGGFLLSFGATAGIILGMPRLVRPGAPGRRRWWSRLWRGTATGVVGVGAATLCAEIALAPIGASLFSRITFAGLALNFAAIPLMTAVQCGSLALLAGAALHAPGTDAVAGFVHRSAWALVESSRFVDLAPWLARDVAPPPWWLIVSYYAASAGVLLVPRHRRAFAVVLAAAGVVLVAGAAPGAGRVALGPGFLRVAVLDVGQGDATVALLPDGRAVLVDAGGLVGTAVDIGGRVVAPALRALGVRRLHALVITHADPDHAGGVEAVMRRIGTAHVWEGIPVPPNPLLRSLTGLAASRRAVWRTLRPGDAERAGGVEVRVHHPPEPDWERQRVRNDDSVVLEFRYGDVSILLPGDIGREVEAVLIPRLTLAPLVILKAAHHGSATSSDDLFLDTIVPRAVIFSAGRNNRFGHPAKAVVDRFHRRGVEMFNTADDGAVFVDTDGKSVVVHGWRAGRRLVINKDK